MNDETLQFSLNANIIIKLIKKIRNISIICKFYFITKLHYLKNKSYDEIFDFLIFSYISILIISI